MKIIAAFLFALFVFASLRADDLDSKDFDGEMLFTGKEGGLLTLEIPVEVYRGVKRADLGDIRIFDAAGIPVPYAIREIPNELFSPGDEEIPFYRLDAEEENPSPPETDIEINTRGGRVRIRNRDALPAGSPMYLADLSSLRFSPRALRIKTGGEGKNFNTRVSVQYSADLSLWETRGKKQTIASFGNIVQDTIELDGKDKSARYLLLGFDRGAPPLAAVTALFGGEEAETEYREETVEGSLVSGGKKVSYNTGAFFPASFVDFILSGADSIPVIVKSRFSENDDWKTEAKGTVFRYNSAENSGGAPLKNEPFALESGNDSARSPFWEIETAGGLPFGSAPRMVIRYRARELVFPARGKGPWTLAYGRADAAPLSGEEILVFGAGAELSAARFTGKSRYTKSAPSALQDNSYRAFLLWAFLASATAALSVLALYIAKTMRK